MKYTFIAILISIYSSTVFAAEYRINEYESRRSYDNEFLELSLKVETGKEHNLNEIFNLISVSGNNFSIRILGLPIETRKELKNYYKNTIPEKLNMALKSSGNLHNPTLDPLINNFFKAISSTNLYKDLEAIIANKKYTINKIEFEKFTIESGEIFIADIWIICTKNV